MRGATGAIKREQSNLSEEWARKIRKVEKSPWFFNRQKQDRRHRLPPVGPGARLFRHLISHNVAKHTALKVQELGNGAKQDCQIIQAM